MIVCPLEGSVIFSGCPVSTCMWHTGAGRCTHGSTNKEPSGLEELDGYADDSEDPVSVTEDQKTKTRILQYVTVGSFLERRAGKELTSLGTKDFPPKEAFTQWCKDKAVRGHRDIPYEEIREHIKREL